MGYGGRQQQRASITATRNRGLSYCDDAYKPTSSDLAPQILKWMRQANLIVELLRSYRIAHARVGAIEAFESSLREYTPLTSISDTGAFVEYLGQLNVKSDMLMEELKRVSKERDELNKKFEDAEKRAKEATDEVETLKSQAPANADTAKDDSTTQVESVAPSSPSKASKHIETTEDTEDFFSYDSELPRLQ